MNCVAIPPPEEKQQPIQQILHNELVLPPPHATPDTSGGNHNTGSGSASKTQSLQRTTHLYCRSLEKERGDRRTSSRGLASCLRGERDEFVSDYREMRPRAQQIDLLPTVVMGQGGGNGAGGAAGGGGGGNNAGVELGNGADAGSRCEYKSKTLPRIHFDTSINDTSLNEGEFVDLLQTRGGILVSVRMTAGIS
ncbi:uncharacterized protein LOC129238380 [Anastrepha obliqua]|uniref:uncharacterized protein LOC129238380 n=1 Tax=Anastrepha obliqua TaxID=95512 RepID=UPI00240A727B|nr:uncharacterized protein LOC129238380 [Anastrepha obliqua]